MKSRKFFGSLGMIAILALLLVACSSKKDMDRSSANVTSEDSISNNSENDTGTYGNLTDFTSAGSVNESNTSTGDGLAKPPLADDNAGLNSSSQVTAGQTEVTQDKIIRTFFMDVETQEFDSLLTKINADIKRLNGYTESSQINGKGYKNDGETRNGSIVARVPSDKVDEFVSTVKDSDKANVISQQESSENVSLQYIEAESRAKTLNIEQDRLFVILEKEINLDNIITLESRLSDIRYELQNYESQIRYYDNMVAYSTVTLNISEVEKLTPVTKQKQSVGSRISNGLGDTLSNLGEGFKNFFVWFVVNLPYLLIWGVIIAAIALIVRREIKKNNAVRATRPDMLSLYGQHNSMQNSGQQNMTQPNPEQQNISQPNQGPQNISQPNPGQLNNDPDQKK